MDECDDWLKRAVAGDEQALVALLERHGPEVRQAIHIDTPWRTMIDADDVMQVTYLEACLAISRFRPQGTAAFVAWLRRIAINNLRDAIEALQRDKRPDPRKRTDLPADHDSRLRLYEHLVGESKTPSRAARRAERLRQLEDSIQKLPRDYAAVVRLLDLEERSTSEAAATMNRSVGAVKMLKLRAHDRLRELLSGESDFLGSA